MTEPLFTRHGEPIDPMSVRTTSKGAPYIIRAVECSRCGGAGYHFGNGWGDHAASAEAGNGSCFKCIGEGKVAQTFKLYTAAKLAALNARADKMRAKKQAAADAAREAAEKEAAARRVAFETEHAELIGNMRAYAPRSEFLADVLAKAMIRAELSPGQIEAATVAIKRLQDADTARAKSQHIGEVGERIERAVTVARVNSYARPVFGASWKTETFWIVSMNDADGNCIVSKSPNFHAPVGDSFTLRATVKEHSDYKGLRQTIVQRVNRK